MNYMDLSILDKQLNVGQVKSIHTGTHLDYIEMKFSNELSVQLAPLDNKTIQFNVKDNEFRIPNVSCKIGKTVVKDFIMALKELYSQLETEGVE